MSLEFDRISAAPTTFGKNKFTVQITTYNTVIIQGVIITPIIISLLQVGANVD